MSNLINYNELWRLLHQKKHSKGVDWDKRAHSFFRAVSGSEEPEKVISSLNLREADTVLDMGAGTGRFAVPMARKVSHLTALEPSTGMSSYLEKGMLEAGLTNYSVVRKRWEDVVIGRDLPVHDVVFASNSLGFPDLAAGLKKLDDAATRSVHILWFAGNERHPMDPELARRLGKDGKGGYWPDYLFILNVLHSLGIYANVSVEPVRTSHAYEDLDEAVSWWSDRSDIEPDQIPVLREYLAQTLKPMDDGRISMSRSGWRARIWWEKGIRAE
jgi:SAM-dependent methyltransferase